MALAYLCCLSLLAFQVCAAPAVRDEPVCGYQSCDLGKADMLNVHIVPHTHDDVGWLKTVDQYYYGARDDIQQAGVQYILDSVITELDKDPKKRFIYVEMAFFYRWWDEQSDDVQHMVKRFVDEGRLEFILGGWCMNDEASTHYNAIIDQHTTGFKFLNDTFGPCAVPRIGWQIDPFGHSREQASLFAQFGFDGLFFGRLDYQDKNKRLKDKTMELMWLASDSLGDQASLFTGVNYDGYGPPSGFCFDQGCSDDPMMDDKRLEDFNVDSRVKEFLKACNDQAKNYTTNHIMLTMGSDFQYQNAHKNYKNLDKLIQYVNQQSNGSKINTFYSTPSCYLYALNKANKTYTTKQDDFFPYASRAHTFWTGYFTSRPALKGYVRQSNTVLQVCKQLDVLAQISEKYSTRVLIDKLRQAMGVAQHHDAVSGTSKQAVADDYAKRLALGTQACEKVIDAAYSELLPKKKMTAPKQTGCVLLNVTRCHVSELNSRFTVTVYNPVARLRQHFVRVPISGDNYMVTGPDGADVHVQFVPVSPETRSVPAFNGSKATGELVFMVELPALGFNTYFIESTSDFKFMSKSKSRFEVHSGGDTVIQNEELSLKFDGSSGLLTELTVIKHSETIKVKQSLMYYQSMSGNNTKPELQASGAYAFRPMQNNPVAINEKPTTTFIKGSLVQEVHQVFGDWASQVFRLYKYSPYVEIEWTVGPIPYKDKVGKEVISRFETNLATSKTFYTDANGRELQKRVRDYRPTWDLNQTEEVAGNYYPVNSRIAIVDTSRNIQMTVMTDRSQGGASIKDGQMELMVHRRLFYDDSFGVGEPLNETGINGKGLVVRGRHLLAVNTTGSSSYLHRDAGEKLFMQPHLTFAPLKMSVKDYIKNFNTMWSGVKTALPYNVHLLTLEEFTADTFLLRLENFYPMDEAGAKTANISLPDMFLPFTITGVTELTLGGNQELKTAKRLQWNVKNYGRTKSDMSSFVTPVNSHDLTVTLKPMQIRTFRITIKPRSLTYGESENQAYGLFTL